MRHLKYWKFRGGVREKGFYNLGEIRIILSAFLIFFFTIGKGQNVIYLQNGTYQFLAETPGWYLHFYLFGDGYHSFEQNPIHQYGTYSIPAEPEYYTSDSYTQNDPTQNSLGIINNGVPISIQESIEFQNQIEVKRSWNLVPEGENFFILMFENSEYDHEISGCVEFHFNNSDLNIEEDLIFDDYGNHWVEERIKLTSSYNGYSHKYKWNYSNLRPGEQRFIYLKSKCLGESMSSIVTRGILKVEECDGVVPENWKEEGSNEGVTNGQMYTLVSIVSNNPHDPNVLQSSPNCLNNESQIQKIRYKLYFQNEGNDASEDVLIRISASEEFGSVELIDASYNCKLVWNSQTVTINYEDIFLKGLYQNPPPNYFETVGWVEFDVCFNIQDIFESNDLCVDVEANVFFDEQIPVLAENEICKEEGCIHVNSLGLNECSFMPSEQGYQHQGNHKYVLNVIDDEEFDFKIQPNLVQDYLSIFVNGSNSFEEFLIYDINGNVVQSVDNSRHVNIINLSPGLYYILGIRSVNPIVRPFIKL